MPIGGLEARSRKAGAPRRQMRRRLRRSRLAVSEVIATIILLALTVVLFSAIFAFVTSFPSPPSQSANQFQASLAYGTASGSTVITQVKILHLAGPAVPPSALIYIKSAANPSAPEFANGYNLSQGGLPYGTNWNLGQTWLLSFPSGSQPGTPDNLTLYVIAGNQVLFSVILPGQSFPIPPVFIATATNPGTPGIGGTFNVTATLAGSVVPYSVYVNLAGIWGFNSTTPKQMTYAAATGQYYLLTNGIGTPTTSGTFYAFLNATGSTGQTATTSLVVTITATGSVVLPASLALAPNQGVSKATMTASGAGFADSTSVALAFNGATVTMASCSAGTLSGPKTSVTTTATGTFSCAFTIPSPGAGTWSVVATDATSGQSATGLFTITKPAIVTSVNTVAPGHNIWVNGTGFSVSSTVAIFYLDHGTNTTMGPTANPCIQGSLITTGTGTFSCEFTVPSGDSSATTSTLSVMDVSSGVWVTKTITN